MTDDWEKCFKHGEAWQDEDLKTELINVTDALSDDGSDSSDRFRWNNEYNNS